MGLFSSIRRVKPQGAAESAGGKASDIKATPQAVAESVTLDDFKAEVVACDLGDDWKAVARLEHLFAAFDLDGNGWVDQEEFSQTANQLRKLLQALEGVSAKEPATAPTPKPKPREGRVSAHEAPPDYSAQLRTGAVIPCDEAGPYCPERFHSNASGKFRGYCDEATRDASVAAMKEWCAKQTSWGSIDIANLPDIQHLFQYGDIAGKGLDMRQLRPLIDRAQQEMWRDYSMAYWRTRVPGTAAAQMLLLLERAYEYSEKAFLEAHPGGKAAQRGVESIVDLYTGALKAMSSLWNLTTALRAKSGEEGAGISWGAKKGRRIWDKAHTKYGGDLSRVTDCARSSLVFESLAALVATASLLLDRPEAVGLERAAVVGFKNRFANPTDEAYRDLLFNVVLDGHVCEVQLHLKAMADAKKGGAGHRMFTLCRRVLFAPTVAKDTYTGERDAAGKPHGQGKMVYADGGLYEGAWVADKKEGRGTFRSATGNVYEGQWRADKKEGRGKYRYADGSVYDGQLKAGNKEGRGTMRFADGNVYEGQYKADKKEGRGTERLASGNVQQGEFRAGKFYTGIQWNADRKTTLLAGEGKVQGEPSLEEAAERVKQLRLEPP